MLDCFKDSVGITNIDCVCDDPARPTDYNVSLSGLYLSQLLPMQFAKAANNCNYGDMWQMSADSIVQGELLVNQQVMQLADANMKKIIAPYRGIVGDINKLDVSDYNVQQTYLYEKLYFRNVRKGKLTIKRIGLHLNQAITTSIGLYDCNANLIQSHSITTVANTVTWITLATPYVIDMSDINNRCLFIAYDRMGAKPKADKFHCGCGGGGFKYDELRPQWNANNAQEWGKFMIAGTGATDNLSMMPNNSTCNAVYNNGMFLDIESDCEFSLCSNATTDYKNNPFYFAIAFLIQRKAAIIQIEKIQLANKIDVYLNDLPAEQIQAMINKWQSEYETTLQYVKDYILTNATQFTDCYACFNPTGFKTVPIKV